jgi:methylase of polypeptide subunit release factors
MEKQVNPSNPGREAGMLRRLVQRLYPVYLPIAQWVRSHPLLIRWFFGVRLPKGEKISWDFTTLALRYALRKRLSPPVSVLEIGVGQAALLCIYLARKQGIQADGVDIVPERAAHSQQVARYNAVPLHIRQSDLFEKVRNTYDVIFWNAAYIPTGFGNKHRLTHRQDLGDRRAWDGGDDGTEPIRRFLHQVPRYLNANGRILLGVNRFYVPETTMARLLETVPLVMVERMSRPFNPSVVYILRHHIKEVM